MKKKLFVLLMSLTMAISAITPLTAETVSAQAVAQGVLPGSGGSYYYRDGKSLVWHPSTKYLVSVTHHYNVKGGPQLVWEGNDLYDYDPIKACYQHGSTKWVEYGTSKIYQGSK